MGSLISLLKLTLYTILQYFYYSLTAPLSSHHQFSTENFARTYPLSLAPKNTLFLNFSQRNPLHQSYYFKINNIELKSKSVATTLILVFLLVQSSGEKCYTKQFSISRLNWTKNLKILLLIAWMHSMKDILYGKSFRNLLIHRSLIINRSKQFKKQKMKFNNLPTNKIT